jgi:hypothetical protein
MGGLISSERDFDIDPRAVSNIQITAANTIKSSSLEALTTAISNFSAMKKRGQQRRQRFRRPVISDRL